MSKKKCKISDEKYQAKLPDDPKYQCKKCGRVSKKEDTVCKAIKIKKSKSSNACGSIVDPILPAF